MSEDSLITDEQEYSKSNLPPSMPSSSSPNNLPTTCSSPTRKSTRSNNLDEHIKSVQQKKEEVNILRLQKFQEQLRKKEQKW